MRKRIWAIAKEDGAAFGQITVAEAAMPVLREGRMVGHVTIEPKAAEPAVCQVEVNLFAQAPLRADAETVTDQQHPDHQFGAIEGRPIVL
jgi:hypothetical protein